MRLRHLKQRAALIFAVGVSVGLCPLLIAQPAVIEGEDLSFLQRFGTSSLIRYEQLDGTNFSFPTAKVKRVGGVWQPETQRLASGNWTSLTYKISDRFRVDEVLSFFEAQLAELGAEEIYRCTGLSCGNSNKWANLVFGEKRLYGPHTNQRYIVSNYKEGVVSFYIIKRGNKRVYARVDYVESDKAAGAPTSAADARWLIALQQQGRAHLGEADSLLATTDSMAQLNELATWLKESDQKIYVVVHRYGNLPVPDLLRLGQQQADNFSEKLQVAGVEASQIRTFSVGPLASGEEGVVNRMTILAVDSKDRIGR